MIQSLGFVARIEAKPGKEAEVEAFLDQGSRMAADEAGTLSWFAVRTGPQSYTIFDTFGDENARHRHITGPIGDALRGVTPDLFVTAPEITPVDVVAHK